MRFSAFFKIYSRPYPAKKKCEHFSSPKKNWRRGRTLKPQHRLGRPSETKRPGVRLWRPGGYLRFTLGLPSANVGITSYIYSDRIPSIEPSLAQLYRVPRIPRKSAVRGTWDRVLLRPRKLVDSQFVLPPPYPYPLECVK